MATQSARILPQTPAHKTPTTTPTQAAKRRCPCSRRTGKSAHQPSGLKLPKLRGQSGTAIPACQLVTRPPIKIRQNTKTTAPRAVQISWLIFKRVVRNPAGVTLDSGSPRPAGSHGEAGTRKTTWAPRPRDAAFGSVLSEMRQILPASRQSHENALHNAPRHTAGHTRFRTSQV